MLFPPNPILRPSAVFSGLYSLLKEVLRASCSGRPVSPTAIPAGLWAAVQANLPTRTVLTSLEAAVQALPEKDRYDLWLATWSAPTVRELICDSSTVIPTPPDQIVKPLKAFVTHLFDSTAKLVDVERACGESVHLFCSRYASNKPVGNGRVCSVCGTDVLSQTRFGVAMKKQWRATIDHLLAEATYPLIALEPANLLPTCHHCNTKAKHAKDLLHDEKGNRRICFDPWTESAHGLVHITVRLTGLAPEADVAFASPCPKQMQKLTTWDAVYEIRSRIKSAFSSLAVTVSKDLDLNGLPQFLQSIGNRASTYSSLARSEPYNYWRSLLYQELGKQPAQELEQLRATCREALDRASGGFAEQFGI